MLMTRNIIRQLIIEALSVAGSDDFFGGVLSELIDNPHLLNDQKWLSLNGIHPVAAGQSRGVYVIAGDDDIIIKQAISDRGLSDNKKEVAKFNKYSELFPMTYAHAPDFSWVLIEKVNVIGKSPQDTVQMIQRYMPVLYNVMMTKMVEEGLNVTDPKQIKDAYYDFIFNLEARKEKLQTVARARAEGNPAIFDRIFRNLIKLIKGRSVNVLYGDHDVLNVIKNDKKFYHIYKAATDFGIAFRELRGDNFGVNREGNLVMIDLSVF